MARFNIRGKYLLESRPRRVSVSSYTRVRPYMYIYRVFSESPTNGASLQGLPRTRCTRATVSDPFVLPLFFLRSRNGLFGDSESVTRSHGAVLNIIDTVQPRARASPSAKNTHRLARAIFCPGSNGGTRSSWIKEDRLRRHRTFRQRSNIQPAGSIFRLPFSCPFRCTYVNSVHDRAVNERSSGWNFEDSSLATIQAISVAR